jgi:predicted porin
MKVACLVVLALGASAGLACAQSNEVYRVSVPAPGGQRSEAVIEVNDLYEPGMTDSATKVFGYPGKRMGLENVAEVRPSKMYGFERDRASNRAWGVSVGLTSGPMSFRIAHQNKNVAKIAPAMPLGLRTDAKNTIIAANIDLGGVKAYTAYSASRGWGSSPLWNPDNPYGAGMATTPTTDSRDVLIGFAKPLGHTTLLASFVRKNDRDVANRDADQFALGGTYSLSRKTDFYAAYSHVRLRKSTMTGLQVAPVEGWSALNVGMRHSF